ncbi:MAG: endolytic transglycosylase MltG [Ferruginibacter sp.]|nr:endolytic transglycosylase MltG [Chitinophagaceae bacterium]
MKKKLIIGIILVLLGIGGFISYKLFSPALANKQGTWFYITTGEDLAGVKNKLVEQHHLRGSGFDWACKILKFKKIKPGRYKLKDGMSAYQLVKMLRSGNQVEVKMVINKERTKEIFAGKFGKGKKYDVEFDSLQMISFLNNNDSLKKFGVDTNTVMALVMPYTYTMKWNTSPDKIVQQFSTAYQKFWTAGRKAKADSIRLTPLQVVSLASIVEEETNKKADKYNIASTYLNRVRTGMKLQADPTVKFAMKNFALKRVLGVHLKTDSPYNTYMYAGIPPGPICTPSVESIDAVLDAPASGYLYFVASSNFDGTTVFTTDYSDHLKYARLYQEELTRRMDSSKKAKSK